MSLPTAGEMSQEEYDQIHRQISQLRLSDLKLVARSLSIAQAGRKADVADRIRKYLQTGREQRDNVRVLSIQIIVDRASNFQEVPPFEVVYREIFSETQGRQRIDLNQTRSSLSSQDGLPRSQTNPRRAWLFFKENPFFVLKKLVTPNAGHCYRAPETRGTCRVTFALNEQDHALLKSSSKNKLFLLCGAFDRNKASTDALVEFPQPLEIHFNGTIVKDNVKGLKNKPGTARPANLTPYIAGPNSQNTLEMVYAFTKHDYLIFCYLIEEVSPEKLLQKILANPHIAKQKTLDEFTNADDDDEDDIQEMSTRLSLKCPLSFTRFKYPTKSIACKHLPCFDALSFIYLQEQAPAWTCPVCSIPVRIKDLAIDDYVMEIMKNTSEDVETVEIDLDGSWKAIHEDDDNNNKNRSESYDQLSTAASKLKREESEPVPVSVSNSPIVISLDSDEDEEEEIVQPTPQPQPSLLHQTPQVQQQQQSSQMPAQAQLRQQFQISAPGPNRPLLRVNSNGSLVAEQTTDVNAAASHQDARISISQTNSESSTTASTPTISTSSTLPPQQRSRRPPPQIVESPASTPDTEPATSAPPTQAQPEIPPVLQTTSPSASDISRGLDSASWKEQSEVANSLGQIHQHQQTTSSLIRKPPPPSPPPQRVENQQPIPEQEAQSPQLNHPQSSAHNPRQELQSQFQPNQTHVQRPSAASTSHLMNKNAPQTNLQQPLESGAQTQVQSQAEIPAAPGNHPSSGVSANVDSNQSLPSLHISNITSPTQTDNSSLIRQNSATYSNPMSPPTSTSPPKPVRKLTAYEAEKSELEQMKLRISRAGKSASTSASPIVPPAVPSHQRFDRLSTGYNIPGQVYQSSPGSGGRAYSNGHFLNGSSTQIVLPQNNGPLLQQFHMNPQVADQIPLGIFQHNIPQQHVQQQPSQQPPIFGQQSTHHTLPNFSEQFQQHQLQHHQAQQQAQQTQQLQGQDMERMRQLQVQNQQLQQPTPDLGVGVPTPQKNTASLPSELRRAVSNPISQTIDQSNLKASLDNYQQKNGINRANTINIVQSQGNADALTNIQKLKDNINANRVSNSHSSNNLTTQVQGKQAGDHLPNPTASLPSHPQQARQQPHQLHQNASASSRPLLPVPGITQLPDKPGVPSPAPSSAEQSPPLRQKHKEPNSSGTPENIYIPNWSANNLLRPTGQFSPSRFTPQPADKSQKQPSRASNGSNHDYEPLERSETPEGATLQRNSPSLPSKPALSGGILGINIDPNNLLKKKEAATSGESNSQFRSANSSPVVSNQEVPSLPKPRGVPNIFIPPKRPGLAEKKRVSSQPQSEQQNLKRPLIQKSSEHPGNTSTASDIIDLTTDPSVNHVYDDDDDIPLLRRDDNPLGRAAKNT